MRWIKLGRSWGEAPNPTRCPAPSACTWSPGRRQRLVPTEGVSPEPSPSGRSPVAVGGADLQDFPPASRPELESAQGSRGQPRLPLVVQTPHLLPRPAARGHRPTAQGDPTPTSPPRHARSEPLVWELGPGSRAGLQWRHAASGRLPPPRASRTLLSVHVTGAPKGSRLCPHFPAETSPRRQARFPALRRADARSLEI